MDAAARRELQENLARLADGDRSAFHPLFDTAWPMLRRFARRALGDASLADDAAQSALLKVFARASEFDPAREALPWLLAIAFNECRTLRRQAWRRRKAPLETAGVVAGGGRSPEEEAVRADLHAAARAVLDDLPPADVDVLLSAVEDGRTRPTGVAFRKRLQRARERLRKAWRTRHGTC